MRQISHVTISHGTNKASV